MTALASSDVTVTVAARDRDIGRGALAKNVSVAGVAFGDGSLTYPAGGVPMPGIGSFGFLREIKVGLIEQPPGDGFVYKYDQANHKIRIYTQGVATGATVSAGATASKVKDSAGAETDVQFVGAAVSQTYDLGPQIELPTGTAVANVSMNMLLVGE